MPFVPLSFPRNVSPVTSEISPIDGLGRMFIPHRIHGAAIYGNIYQYTPNVI